MLVFQKKRVSSLESSQGDPEVLLQQRDKVTEAIESINQSIDGECVQSVTESNNDHGQ